MLIDELKELNDTLYKAFGELRENHNNINNTKYQDGIAEKIYELYELDYKRIRGRFEAEDKAAFEFELKKEMLENELERCKEELKPKKRRRWWLPWTFKSNRAENVISREAGATADILLNAKERAVEELERIIQEADNTDVRDVLCKEFPPDRTDTAESDKLEPTAEPQGTAAANHTLSAKK